MMKSGPVPRESLDAEWRRSTGRRLAWLPVATVAGLAVASLLLMVWINRQWRDAFRSSISAVDNLSQSRAHAAEASALAEKALSGDATTPSSEVLAELDRAFLSLRDCRNGVSRLAGVPGLPPADPEFLAALERFESALRAVRRSTEERMAPASGTDPHHAGIVQRQSLHDLKLAAAELDLDLSRTLGAAYRSQFRWLKVLASLWVAFGVGLAGVVWASLRYRRMGEQMLARSEARLRALVTASSDVLYAMSPDWHEMRHLTSNRPLPDGTGPGSDWIGKYIFPEDRATLRAAAEEAIRTRSPFELEHRFRSTDGSAGWVISRAIPVPDEAGGIAEWFGAASDITERKRAEAALQDAIRFNQQIIDGAREGVIVLDLELRYRVWNRFMEELTGVQAAAILGRTPVEVFPELRATGLPERLRQARNGESPEVADFGIRFPNGREAWLSDLSAPLRNANGEITGVIETLRDITEQKRAEEERARMEAQFIQSQKMESIGRLAGGVAHDFNNLLTVINGYSVMVVSELNPGDPLRHQVEEIRRAGEMASGLTRQLLAFSRKQILQPRTLSLNQLITGTHRMIERLVGEDIEVLLALTPEDPAVHADPVQLEQVIVNLSVNSRDAMPRGGRLLLETSIVERDEAYAARHPDTRACRYALLRVTDTGIGMDAATKERVFEPFFTTKPAGRGTGLGLATVQGIVAQSGGHIRVESHPGQGTTFGIYLPTTNVQAAATAVAQPDAHARGHEVILVVEDQAEVLSFTVAALKAYGYQPIPAKSATEALVIVAQQGAEIDLILADVVMPNLSGRELVARVAEARPEIRALYMSGYNEDVMVRHGILDGGVNLIQKPFTPEELARRVRSVLGGKF